MKLELNIAFLCFTEKTREAPASCSRFREKEYLFFNHKRVVYEGAKNACLLWNAHLAIIPDNETQQHLVENMPTGGDECVYNKNRSFYYIGLLLRNGEWIWPDNTTLRSTGFSNWRRSIDGNESSCNTEPNGHRNCPSQPGNANASQISGCNYAIVPLGAWFDKNEFTSDWYYICERMFQNATGKSS